MGEPIINCKWAEFTGIDCKKEATHQLIDPQRHQRIPVCKEHFDEYVKDHR